MKNSLRSVCSVVLVALVASTSSASAFNLGELTKPMGHNIQAAFIQAKARTAAPFAHVLFCKSMPNECISRGGPDTVHLDRSKRRELQNLNRAVNRQIVARNDNAGYLGGDEWSLAPAAGDCEDFAITKRHALIASGWPSGALRLAMAYTAWGEGHLVLVVRTNRGDLVLDNLTNSVRAWNKTGLRWEMIQSSEDPNSWYRI